MKAQNIRPNQTNVAQPEGVLQRKCASCSNHTLAGGKCDECKSKAGLLQRRSKGHSQSSKVPQIVHEVLRSPGQALDAETRAFFEPRFWMDFSHVKVHTDARAIESARAIGALAYSHGNNIVLGTGSSKLAPSESRSLLAHELTHVVQQAHTDSAAQMPDRISSPSDDTEIQAERVASAVGNLDKWSSSWRYTDAGYQGSLSANGYHHAANGTIQRSPRSWPFNGYVVNNSSQPVTVWSDEQGLYQIPAGSTSGRFTEDVDHIQDSAGQWYKIGAGNVTVDANGRVSGYKCRVSNYGQDCPE